MGESCKQHILITFHPCIIEKEDQSKGHFLQDMTRMYDSATNIRHHEKKKTF